MRSDKSGSKHGTTHITFNKQNIVYTNSTLHAVRNTLTSQTIYVMIVLLNKKLRTFRLLLGWTKTPKGPYFLAIYIYVHIQLTFGI